MKLDRTINAKRNIIWGWINRIIKIICPFLIRTVIIYKLGMEYLGLNSLFTSVLSIFSLAELGFDSAVVCIMYKSIAENDDKKLNALLFFLKKVYLVVGLIILAAGFAYMPLIKYTIKDIDSLPKDINIYYIYLIFLINTVSGYFFGAYRNSIINAYQRQDVISNINSVITFLSAIIQIYILIFVKNYYLYLYTLPVFTLITNFIIIYLSKKMFLTITPSGNLDSEDKKELKKMVEGTFLARFGGVLSISFDNVITATFLGITILAKYANYNYIIEAVKGFLIVIYSSMQAGIGNKIMLESKEQNYKSLRLFTFMFDWIAGWCFYCFVFLITPFIYIWIGQQSILPNVVLILMALNFYLSIHDSILGIYKAALGIWWEDRFRCLIGGIVNLILNICIVNLLINYGEAYALVGIILSTIISQILILTPWATHVTFKMYFKNGIKKYYIQLSSFFVTDLIIIVISYPLFKLFPIVGGTEGILFWLIRLILCIAIPNTFFLIRYFRNELFKESIKFISNKLITKKEGV